MKTLSLTLILSIFLFGCKVQKTDRLSSADKLLTAKGSKLTWLNTSFGKSYFYIDVNEISIANGSNPNVIDVNFSMSSRDDLKGRIKMTDEALENAMDMYNYFKAGDVTLTDKTTVWLSQKVNKLMKDNEPFIMGIDRKRTKTLIKFTKGVHIIKVKNHKTVTELKLPVIRAIAGDGEYLEMHDSHDGSNPLITRMNLRGLKLELTELDVK